MKAYLLVVSGDSSLDKFSNNWSLFRLLERLGLPGFPALLPFNVHAHFELEDEEIGLEHQFRFVLVLEGGGEDPSDPGSFTSRSKRHRVKSEGMFLREPGYHHLYVEWRQLDADDWHRSEVGWPLECHKKEEDGEQTPPAVAGGD